MEDVISRRESRNPFIRATPCFLLCRNAVLFFLYVQPPVPLEHRLSPGDGNIPASNTSALLYARTRTWTETIPPPNTQRSLSTPVCVCTMLGVTQTSNTATWWYVHGKQRGWKGGDRLKAEVLKLADWSLVMAVRSSVSRVQVI